MERTHMFDARRFWKLAVVQWAEYGRSYLWFLGIGIAVHLCTVLLVTNGGARLFNYTKEMQMAVYIAGYLITGSLFALRYFSALSDRDSALTCLMRPASALEKFLLAFLIVAVLYPLAYTLAFQVCNLPGAHLGEAARDANILGSPREVIGYRGMQDFGPYLPFTQAAGIGRDGQLLLGTLFLQALVLAGTLYFRRVAWLKTVVALFVLLVLGIPLLAIATGASPDLLFFDNARRAHSLQTSAWQAAVWFGVPLLMWASVFFFLRERELQ
jgi:hypothetical protein